jgi:N4-gp56 family major capsid protein
MATQSTTNPASIVDQFQTYFSRKMLKHREHTLQLAGLAGVRHEADIQQNNGNVTIRCFKKRKAKTDDVVNLTEGTAISTFTEIDSGYVDATLTQIGEAAKVTDILQMTAIFNWINQNIETLGEDAALKMDTVIRNAIVAGLLNQNSKFEVFAGVPYTGVSATDFVSLAALPEASAKLTRLHFLGAQTTLKKNLVPLIAGGTVALVSPAGMQDLRQDDAWLKAAQFSRPEKLYKMEEMSLDGVRFIEGTNPLTESGTYGTVDTAGGIYSNFVFGRAAFGVPKLTGAGNPTKPTVIINNKPDKSDPLNQFCVLGWKSFYTAKLMLTSLANDVPGVVNIRAKATYDA